jgi:serralysin
LTLIGNAGISGTGNGLNNVLSGNSAANTLNGGAGSDSMRGALGKDTLTGSTGIDNFVYRSVTESGVESTLRDVITDFQGSSGEKINLSAIDTYSGAADNQAFTCISSNAFTGTKGEVRFSGGVLQMNTGTDKIADMEIALTGVTTFS